MKLKDSIYLSAMALCLTIIAAVVAALMAGCSSSQTAALVPRGPAHVRYLDSSVIVSYPPYQATLRAMDTVICFRFSLVDSAGYPVITSPETCVDVRRRP
jgi:hypothetical protein